MVDQIWHCQAFNQNSMAQKIRFRADKSTDLKKNSTGNFQYREKVFLEASSFVSLLWKNGFVFVNQIWHFKPWTNIAWPGRSDFGFWLTSKKIYRKLKHRDKVFGEFPAFCCFPEKLVLHLSRKFCILKPDSNIHSLRRFDLGHWQTSKQIYRKLRYR